MPIRPLSFKGEKKSSSSRKRKHDTSTLNDTSLVTTTATSTAHSQTPNTAAEDDDSWTSPNIPSDLSGPTMLVLPTQPPTCLACDSHGNVFASPIENMIDSDPRTSEPHDIRQVWVTSKIAGMGDGEVGFKGSHGGWLGCDEYGILGARREARGVEEGFRVELVAVENTSSRRGQWRIRTIAGTGAASSTATTTKEGGNKPAGRYLSAATTTLESASATTQATPHPDSDSDSSPSTKKKKKVSISLRGDGTIPISSSSTSIPTTEEEEENHDPTLMHIKMQSRFLPLTHQQQSDAQSKEKISRRELEAAVGRKLDDDEVKRLKRAKRQGGFHEELLRFRTKGKHDKFA